MENTRLQEQHSMTGILIVEASTLRENIHTELAIRILANHGYKVTERQVYSLLNGGYKWFTRVSPKTFRLAKAGYIRAMLARGLEPFQAVQKYCKKCGDPFIDESDESNEVLCAKTKCKREPWTADEKASRISNIAMARLDNRQDGLIR